VGKVMSFIDVAKEFLFHSEDEYESDEYLEVKHSKRDDSSTGSQRHSSSSSKVNHTDSFDALSGFSDGGSYNKKVGGTVVHATVQTEVFVVKPEVFDDAKAIAAHIVNKKTIVLNLETASFEQKRRIIDFLVGVAYAVKGKLKVVANNTYLITPENVSVTGKDLEGALENNGIFI